MRKVSLALGATTLLSIFLVGTFVGWAVAQSSQKPTDDRSIGDIRKDVTAFVKRSKSKDSDEKSAAIFDLCMLHREIVTDPRFKTDENMVGFRAVVGNRLKKCKLEVESAQKKEIRELKKANAKLDKPESDELLFDEALESMSDEVLLASTMSEHLHTIGQMSGGPTQIFAYANGNFGPGNAQELISLIETTISPDSWEANGGNGRMFFYQPVCALVVSASSDAQSRVGDLLRMIRRNQ